MLLSLDQPTHELNVLKLPPVDALPGYICCRNTACARITWVSLSPANRSFSSGATGPDESTRRPPVRPHEVESTLEISSSGVRSAWFTCIYSVR